MSGHRYWGIRLDYLLGYGFQPPIGTLQIKQIHFYYHDENDDIKDAILPDTRIVATSLVDVYGVYPPNSHPSIDDPWYNGLTPINPDAVKDNSNSTYCTFPDNFGLSIPNAALFIDFGTFVTRDITSIKITYGDISPTIEEYFILRFIYSDDGVTWVTHGSVIVIGNAANTTDHYGSSYINSRVYVGESANLSGPVEISLKPEELTIRDPDRLSIYNSGGYQYWRLEFSHFGVIWNDYNEIELYSTLCGQNIAPQATLTTTTPQWIANIENTSDQNIVTLATQAAGEGSTADIVYSFNGPRNISQVNIYGFFDYGGVIDEIKLYYSSTGLSGQWNLLGTWYSQELHTDWQDINTIQNNPLVLKNPIVLGREFCPIFKRHSLVDGQLSVVSPIRKSVPLSSEQLSITDNTLLISVRSFKLISNSLIFSDNRMSITPVVIDLSFDPISISEDIMAISLKYDKQISEIINTLLSHVEERYKTAFLAESISTLVNVIDDYILYLVDTISVESIQNVNWNTSISVEELINVDSLTRISFLISILDSLNIVQTDIVFKEGYRVIDEKLSINSEFLNNIIGNNGLSEYIDIEDFSLNPFLKLITESINTNSDFLSKLISGAFAQNNIFIDSSLVQHKLDNLTIEDQINILSTLDSTAILNIILSDYISFVMKDDDGRESTYYGWVYNPENHAITNYDFNFSEVTNYQDNTYLANNTGLYLLDGNQDEGTYIQSKIKTAGLQFGARTEKQIPQVFLGIGGDNHIVTVSVDENKTSYYEMKGNPDDGLATKTLKIGKGLIGNTWQFELVDVDQLDFDLDSLEFFPIFLSRKHKK